MDRENALVVSDPAFRLRGRRQGQMPCAEKRSFPAVAPLGNAEKPKPPSRSLSGINERLGDLALIENL
jgi:hypothetical protein